MSTILFILISLSLYCLVGFGVMWTVTSVICYPDINNLLHTTLHRFNTLSPSTVSNFRKENSIIIFKLLNFNNCFRVKKWVLKSSKKDF